MNDLMLCSFSILPGAEEEYYKKIPAVRELARLDRFEFSSPVTFFTGENGSGKSTVIEALAVACGMNAEGGSKNFRFSTAATHSGLHSFIRCVRGTRRMRDSYFLRAESFYNVATEIENLSRGLAPMHCCGDSTLHEQSHGESFLSLVQNRFRASGLYLLDEPEAALSPQRQLTLLCELRRLTALGSQFIISTHSPILLAYPGAYIYVLSENGISKTAYRDTDSYIITKRFLCDTENMLGSLFSD